MRLFVLALISPVQAGEVEAGGEGRRGGVGGQEEKVRKGVRFWQKKKKEKERDK